MGKKARARAARRVDPAAQHRRAVAQLRRLNELVGAYFGTAAHCVEAAALFTRAASELGHEVVPQAVALAAQTDGAPVALGRKAQDAWGPDALSQFEEVEDELEGTSWQDAGHVVITHPASGWIFDPTLPQLCERLGIGLDPFAAQVTSLHPADGSWDFGDQDLGLRYHLVDTDTSWQEGYAVAYGECRAVRR